jgi:glycosyltransferase involved in cell wall biosynthesis
MMPQVKGSMGKKRILYIEMNRDGTLGGSYYSLLYLLQGLNRNLYEPVVMFFRENTMIPDFESTPAEVMVYDYAPSTFHPIRGPYDALRYLPKLFRRVLIPQFGLGKMIDEIRPDILHLNNNFFSNHEWMLACRLRGVKIVAHNRGVPMQSSLQTRIFVRMLDAVICVSDFNLHAIHEFGLSPKLARRVYNGLDPERIKIPASAQQRERYRRELGLSGEDILIGIVGNISRFKGQLVFARAMRMVIERNARAKAVIIGTAPSKELAYEREVRTYIASANLGDRVAMLGFRNDVPDLLNAMDIFVHASTEPEPFGRAVLEAMIMGKPIVATDGGGVRELIVDGESGKLVPMGDHVAMASSIDGYIRDEVAAKACGERAERRSRLFSIPAMVKGVEDVYEELFA